jgi:hypothetical protein
LKKNGSIKILQILVTLSFGMFCTATTADAATSVFNFNPTTFSAGTAGSGPVNPTNGAVTISGSSLATGDTVVFDAMLANVSGTTGDNWASVNLNAAGFTGLTGANLGVIVRTGTGSSQCQIYTNGVAGAVFPGTSEIKTNRIVISLFVSATGSTTNLGYRVQLDQGLTGAFTSTLSGTNLTFVSNSIALAFGAYASAGTVTEFFAPMIQAVHLQLPDTNLLAGASDQSVLTADYLTVSNVAPIYNPGFAYSSSNPGVVTVSSQGLLLAQNNGVATVSVKFAALLDAKTVTVTNVSGTLLALRLVATNQMLVNGTQPGDVRGDFVNVSNVDISSFAQPAFSSGNTNVLTVSALGVIAAIAPGATTIAAAYGGLSATNTITATFPTNRFIFDTFGDGFWIITNSLNRKVLTVSANGATQSVYTNGATDQQFELLYNYSNSTFRIRQRSSWLCIGCRNGGAPIGSAVGTLNYIGAAAQQWYLVDAGNGLFRIINRASNYAMQTDNGNPANVTLAAAWANTAQLWGLSYQTHYPKKGMAGYEGNYAQLGLNWAYNYDDNTTVSLPASVNFVPMIYAAQYWEPLSDAQSRDGGWLVSPQPDYLLTYNEPDNTGANGGSNTSTNSVIGAWPLIQALNLPLISPATANTFGSWMYNFYSLIATNNYRVDYTAVHEYVPPNAASLMGVLQSAYTTWGRPVWLTEFSPVDWSNTKSWSENDDYNFLAEFMWQAEGQEWLKRYSIFAFTGTNSASPWVDNGFTGTMFLDTNQTLSPYGELYATWDADLTLHARTPYIIHNLATSFRMTDTNTSGTPLASTIYVRNATTEWALLPAPATNHWYIISLNDGRRLRNNNGTLDLAPYGTTNSTVDWWFNGPDSNGYYYVDNLALSQSIRGTGTAPAISFGLINDPAPSTATQWRLVKPYQSVTIVTATPPVASITYSNQSAALSWTGNGTFYNVYRSTTSGGGYSKIASLTTNSTYLDGTLQNGTAYFYVVTSLNILGDESSYSTEVAAYPASTMVLPVGFAMVNSGVQFNWPADHTGWRLMMNTNSLANPGAWVAVPGSAATNQMFISIDPTQTNVFFRLIYP